MISPKAQQILDEAMKLPSADRVDVGAVLFNSAPPDPEIEEAWALEIKRRIDEIESGKVKCVPWEEVERDLQQIIDEAKAGHPSRGSR